MENLSAAVSSTRTDYGSTTLEPPSNQTAGDDNDNTSENLLSTHFSTISTNIPIANSAPSDFYQSLPYSSTTNLFERSPKRFGTRNSLKMSSPGFEKMGIDANAKSTSETRQKLERLEMFLGVLNQMCIGFVTIYMSWLCLRMGLSGTALHAWLVTIGMCIRFVTIYMSWLCLRMGLSGTALHAWLVTIGFSFLMAEGVMCHYSANVLTFSYKRRTKTTIHWVLQVLGGSLGVAGALIKCIQKGFLLQSTHGKLGFAAFIFCLASMLSGLAALFPLRIKRLINPLLNKTVHNLLGIVTFFIALLAQYYGYQTGFFSRKVDTDFQILMKCLTLTSLVLTSIGPLKALTLRISNVVKHFA